MIRENLALCSGANSQSLLKNLTATDSRYTQITPSSKAASSKDKLTAGVEVSLRGVKFIRDRLSTTRCMGKAYSSGQMVEFTTVVSNQARKVAKACIFGLMARFTMANSKRTTAQALVSSIIPMVKGLKEHGEMGRSTEKAFIFGRQVRSTTVFTWTGIRKTKESWTILLFLWTNLSKATAASKNDCKSLSRPKSRTDALYSQFTFEII